MVCGVTDAKFCPIKVLAFALVLAVPTKLTLSAVTTADVRAVLELTTVLVCAVPVKLFVNV